MAVEVVADPYSWWMWPLQTKHILKTAREEQGNTVTYISFVIRVVLKAVL